MKRDKEFKKIVLKAVEQSNKDQKKLVDEYDKLMTFDEKFKTIYLDDGNSYFVDSNGNINHPIHIPYPLEIKQFIKDLISEIEKEVVGDEKNETDESWETNSWDDAKYRGRELGHNQKRQRDIEIFKKYKKEV